MIRSRVQNLFGSKDYILYPYHMSLPKYISLALASPLTIKMVSEVILLPSLNYISVAHKNHSKRDHLNNTHLPVWGSFKST